MLVYLAATLFATFMSLSNTTAETKDVSCVQFEHKKALELKTQIEALALDYHNNGGLQASYEECSHIKQVWQDGEVTMTKCGSLLGSRKLAQMSVGVNHQTCLLTSEWLPSMPYTCGNDSYAFVATNEQVQQLCGLIQKLADLFKHNKE